MTGAARREQILDVTKRIVGQDGLHAVSIDRVAREAGISRPIVYEHFSNLPGLLHSLLQREAARASDQLAAALRQLERSGIPPADLLLAALAAYLEAVRAEPVTWRLILTPPESVPASVRRRVEQARAAIVAQLAALVEAAPGPSGGPSAPDPELTAHSMSALSDYWSRLVLADSERYTIERILVHARWALSRFSRGPTPP
jgi:AcrR family transcriptional regulator